jgi:DNA-binding GntR family transcriptional regulator
MPEPLAPRLAADIRLLITQHQIPAGTRLTERALAEQFRVSRSPIRHALRELAEKHIIEPHSEGGFMVSSSDMPGLPTEDAQSTEETLYLQIAGDRLSGLLADRVSENELMRRYGVTRARLHALLRRMTREGWIERLPGHGWEFQPILTSAAYVQSYRFRLLIEPAGMQEPSFTLDRQALVHCQNEQRLLAAGDVYRASPAELFDANTRLHETIAACSGNPFILDSLRRLNQVRRIMEYHKAVDRQQAHRRCEEHLVLIDMLLAGRQDAAVDFMRQHLASATREKTGAVEIK